MKILFYNCPAGISGDMNLGAMVDLGVDPEALLAELRKLGLAGWEIRFTRDQRKGVSGTRCEVIHGEGHHHRTFNDIRRLIEDSLLKDSVKRDAIGLFRVLAEAEATVHGIPAESVHFHEVGAVDSILDMVGAAVCWDLLGIESIAAGVLELGGGTVQCAHGRMPVPAPATARLVKDFPVRMGGTGSEATTPTGAALLAGKGCRFGPVSGRCLATGVGVGGRDEPAIANVLYATLMDTAAGAADVPGEIIELATNLDDMPPERVAFLAELLMEAGALDVWQTPATFKKGRLGCVLSVLIQPGQEERVQGLIFRHSSTIGIRWRAWHRSILQRESGLLETPLGTVRVKKSSWKGEVLRSKIEYEDLRQLARAHKLSISEIEERLRQKDV